MNRAAEGRRLSQQAHTEINVDSERIKSERNIKEKEDSFGL